MEKRKRIAIVGSGISGLSAAYFLSDSSAVTLYEQDKQLGGHSRTIRVQHLSGETIDVDTGFIVFNDRTYPHLNQLFAHLEVEIAKTEMSFGVSVDQGRIEWSSEAFFAQKKNCFNPTTLKGIWDVLKFNRSALRFVEEDPSLTLEEFMKKAKLGSWFQNCYLLPMAGAIWSTPAPKMGQFPAATLIHFFRNHGLLALRHRPQWYTLKNKSVDYVARMEKMIQSKATICKEAKIVSIHRKADGVHMVMGDGKVAVFDEVIFACHPENILQMLADPSPSEKNALSKFSRQKNIAYTHSDSRQMPKRKNCWSSWNYLRMTADENKVPVSYWMNNLQHIDSKSPLFVTLNPSTPIEDKHIYDVHEFYHPLFDKKSVEGQSLVQDLQGQNRAWYCGAYLRYGFHEDGLWSTIELVKRMHMSIEGGCLSSKTHSNFLSIHP